MGTPNCIRAFTFTHTLNMDEHVVQDTCGAHFVLFPYPTAEIQEKCLFIVGVIEKFLEANAISPQI